MPLTVKAIPPSQTNTFIDAQWLFYKNDPHWVAPMKMDRRKLLNVKKNPFFKHSEMQLFLAESDGQIVGRIAAITNANHNETHHDKVGFFGFYESINDKAVAKALLDEAAKWLAARGMDTMRGPVNPSFNDESGLLIDGFDGPPVILMTYNPPYYAELFESAGLHKAKDLYAYLLTMEKYRSEKLNRLVGLVKERQQITFRNVDFKNKAQFQKDVDLIKDMYNKAWQPNWGFVKMTDEEFNFLAADLKQIADPEYVFFVEVKGKSAGFILALPDIYQSLIHNRSGGTFGGVYHLLTKRKKIDLLRIIVLGVLPEYHGTGADAALYHEIGERGARRGILRGEASWILEDNVMMNRGLTETMKADVYRTYRIYDRSIAASTEDRAANHLKPNT